MINDVYFNPTTVFFGKGTETRVGEEVVKHARKVLIHFGGESFKKYGLYEKIAASLKSAGVSIVELGGVRPNPRAELVYEGIELCRKNNIDFILAVGGGSVIDSAKAIGMGVPWGGDFFDFYLGKHVPEKSLKVAAVLTIPGSGSETNGVSVITHKGRGEKIAYSNPIMAPVFAIMNPEVTFTLSAYYTACGIVDAISHILERYFTNTTYVDCTDRIGEGLIKTLMKYSFLVKNSPHDYDIRAEIMWACKLAHDNTAGFGRKQDWSSHAIGHELGAIYDFPHGAILGVLFPAWMSYVYKADMARFALFARKIFGIDTDSMDDEEAIVLSIDKFKDFLRALEMPTNLRELGLHDRTRFPEIAGKCIRSMPSGTIGNFVRLSPGDIGNILEIAY